jgi:hypothetical protein
VWHACPPRRSHARAERVLCALFLWPMPLSSRATAAREGVVAFCALDALPRNISPKLLCSVLATDCLPALSGDEANRLAVIKVPSRRRCHCGWHWQSTPQHLESECSDYGLPSARIPSGRTPRRSSQARTAGATRVVIAAMRKHSQNADLMSTEDVRVLSLLADGERVPTKSRGRAKKNGGVDAVAMAINIHLASAGRCEVWDCRAVMGY